MIGWQVNCNECGKRCVTWQNLKNHIFFDFESIAMIWKDMWHNTQFDNSQII